MERHPMFMDWKTIVKMAIFPKMINLQIQCNLY